MQINTLHLYQFKSHRDTTLDFDAKNILIVGHNGSGKSNILDAIYTLAYTKSYFSSADSYCMMHDTDGYSITAEIEKQDRLYRVLCSSQRGKKKVVKINDKPHQKLVEHIGEFPAVIVSPHDQDLINESADIRRRYFDQLISTFDAKYLYDLVDYQTVLAQRNAYLKLLSQNEGQVSHLKSFDQVMVKLGTELHRKRKTFVTKFLPTLNEIHMALSSEEVGIDINYKSHLNEREFQQALDQSLEHDLRLRHTSVGIHRDDYVMRREGHVLRTYGSQGQKKMAIIALKLSQSLYTYAELGERPLILLDDIFDKLDTKRVDALIHLVNSKPFGQIFITDTDVHRFEFLKEKLNEAIQLVEMA